jgi:calcineurin-like phosphoesterase family protein
MTTWFTSDLHIGHKFVAGLRGFWEGDGEPGPTSVPDVDSHTQAIIKAFSVVEPDDIVWILGDICISASGWVSALSVLRDWCPGRKRLISGNHDPVANHHRDAWKFQKAALEVFESVQEYGRVKFAPRDSPYGGYVLLSHYPYSGTGSDRGEERYSQYRLPDLGMPLIHGHTHGKEKLHLSDRGTPQIHVGMDAWGMKLVPQHDVEQLLDKVPVVARVEEEALLAR